MGEHSMTSAHQFCTFYLDQLLFGLELKGVVIKPDNDDNLQVYGITARDILTGANKISMDKMPAGVRVFPQTLAQYSRRK